MKALIERQLYRPAVVLPLLILMRLMVTLDFSLGQITLVVVAKGARFVYRWVITLSTYTWLRCLAISLRSRTHLGGTMPDGCGCKG